MTTAETREEEPPYDCRVEITNLPFCNIITVPIPIVCNHDTCGLDFAAYPDTQRGYIAKILPRTSAAKIPYQRSLKFSFVISINDTPVTTLDDIQRAFHHLFNVEPNPMDTIMLKIAPCNSTKVLHDPYAIPQLQMDQLNHISQVIHSISAPTTPPDAIIFSNNKPFTPDKISYFVHHQCPASIHKITLKSKLT